ncbi:MAG: S8 family serine peptidase, partial [Acidimicrobiia bacterium]
VCNVVAQGVTVVVAAGNSHVDLVKSVPAAYDEVLTVTAMADFDGLPGGQGQGSCSTKDVDDTAADFSNFTLPDSPDAVHTVAAPGVCVTSTWNDGGYESISGTSMASPHVAGLVARCIDARPCSGLSPSRIIEKIRADAAARPDGTGFFGDTKMPLEGRYYGDLVDASAY